MLKLQGSNLSSRLTFFVALGGVVVGLLVGFLTGVNPLVVGGALFAVSVVVWFFAKFEQAVISLLILRSSLDIFSDYQIPAAFAIGVDLLALLYVTLKLLTGQRVQVDKFWWFLGGWIALQGLWVALLGMGGLGLSASFLMDSIREWIRLFSWLMVYLLVMQLQNRVHPEKIISSLFWALLMPLGAGFLQVVLPPSVLPPLLSKGSETAVMEELSRINGTLGHSNTFATFVLLFIGLTWWKLGQSTKRLPWLILFGILAFFFVSTKALFSLAMLLVFVLVLVLPKLKPVNIFGGLILLTIVAALFASSEFGQERLASLAQTPLVNPDIDISRAILLSAVDNNSFNWRIAQWYYLLQQWQQHPLLGYGLGLSQHVATNGLYPHNDYVRALVEGGIVGFITFLTFLIAQVVRLLKLIYNTPRGSAQNQLSLVLLAFFVSMPVGMLTENIWSHTTLFFYWWTISSVIDWPWQKPPSSSSINVKNY